MNLSPLAVRILVALQPLPVDMTYAGDECAGLGSENMWHTLYFSRSHSVLPTYLVLYN
jgi:hypothetical protein